MPDRPHVRLAEVFVTADPDYTYSSRDSAKLEDAVKDHLEVGSAAAWCVGCGRRGRRLETAGRARA